MKVLLARIGHWWSPLFSRMPFPALGLGALGLGLAVPIMGAIGLGLIMFFALAPTIWTRYPGLRTLTGWRLFGIVAGVLLFIVITSHANPAMAQLFDTVESQAETLFGEYLDSGIIAFIFGVLRIVIWVSAVGFVFFAVYQAQRGEQWQPLLQNAFIIIAAVVIVEGLSRLFFGTA